MSGPNGSINVQFGGTAIQTTNVIIETVEHDQLPDIQLFQNPLSRRHGSKATAAFYTQKLIVISGKIYGSSPANCDSQRDTLYASLVGFEANLDIDYNSGTRRYVATLTKSKGPRKATANFINFAFEFTCSQAFGVDTSSVTLLGTTTVTAAGNTAIAPGGTANTQMPIITAVVNSFTGAGSQGVTIGNPTTSQTITITRTWTAADSIVIDCSALTVNVNSVLTDYAGVFPTWPGNGVSGNISYSDTFSVRNVSLSASQLKRYL